MKILAFRPSEKRGVLFFAREKIGHSFFAKASIFLTSASVGASA